MLLSGCISDGTTLMTVGDTEVTAGQMRFYGAYAMATTDTAQVAETLQQSVLVEEIAKKMNITVPESDITQYKKAIANFKANIGGKKAGDKLLKKYGLNDDFLMSILTASSYASQILEDIDVPEPTEAEEKEYFTDKYLRAKHVLISTKDMTTGEDYSDEEIAEAEKKANEVLEKAEGGADFDELIKEYNEDPGMESNVDGYFFTDGEMVSEFENATKSLESGKVGMCKSDYGYHIILRLPIDASDDKFNEYFEANKDAVKSAVTSEKEKEALIAKGEELGINITVNQSKLDKFEIKAIEQ